MEARKVRLKPTGLFFVIHPLHLSIFLQLRNGKGLFQLRMFRSNGHWPHSHEGFDSCLPAYRDCGGWYRIHCIYELSALWTGQKKAVPVNGKTIVIDHELVTSV